MTLKLFSYLLPKLQNQLTKNGHNSKSKKCLRCCKNCFFQKKKNEVEDIQFSGTFFVTGIF